MNVDKILSNQIVNYVQQTYQKDMAESQLEVLAKSILSSIKKDADFPAIKAAIKQGDHSLLSDKIAQTTAKLVVSSKSPWNPTLVPRTDRQKLVFNVMRGETVPLRDLLKDSSLLSAVLWKPNQELMNEARSLIQDMLVDMHRQMSEGKLTESENFHAEVIIGDLLSLFPFFRPVDGEKFSVPVRIEGVWTLVEYKVKSIKLTPRWMGSPLVAFGLSPANPSASPILICKGTTYPTDDGAGLSLLTDINPFGSVGAYAFSIGKKKIQKWLEKNTKNKKAVVYGKSLGGAQAWRTAINFPDKVDKVMGYGAPGFSPWERRQLYQATKQCPDMQLNFIGQTNDPVPYSDFVAAKGVNYYEIVGEKIQSNPVAAHANMYSTQKKSFIMRLEPQTIANPWKRAAVTITRLIASLFFVVGLVVHTLKTNGDFIVGALTSYIWKKETVGKDVISPQVDSKSVA